MRGIQLDFGTRAPQRSRQQGHEQRKTDPLDGPRTTPEVSNVDRLAAGNLEPRCGLATASLPRSSPPSFASGTTPTIPLTARPAPRPRSCSRCTPGFAASGKSSLSRAPASRLSYRASGGSACRTRCPGRWPRLARRGIEQLGHIGPWFGAATAPGNMQLVAEGEQGRPRALPLGRADATYRGRGKAPERINEVNAEGFLATTRRPWPNPFCAQIRGRWSCLGDSSSRPVRRS